eukprot:TRINITY_DN337_c0_g1_i2.p1 TRINITY_DN337_c0_g1~~TRINITY_DN337_c0_g1_i2.p1  ORF type:complete len:500 (+),score=96.16 TRINITY_DN337_c0_g1_i2:128-1627(+)
MKSYLLLSLLFSIVAAQDLSGKTRYYPQGLTDAFRLANLITPVSYTYSRYTDTSVCITDACNTPSAVTAYQISYANQNTVRACICDDAVFDIEYMALNVGRVPLPARETVYSYTAASVGKGGGAYASAQRVAFFDQLENTEVFIHESAHTYDGAASPGLSSVAPYQNAVNTDACVPDDYAGVNYVEDFAQLTVTWVYYAITGTPVPACLSNSIGYLQSVLPKQSILDSYANTATPTAAPTSSPAPTSTPTSSPAPTSTPGCIVSVRQTLANSWISNGITYSQFDVLFSNNGATATDIQIQLFGQISQVWNLEQHKDGIYYLPSYQSSIAAGSQYSWGYIIQGTSAAVLHFVAPSSCGPSSTTSAPTTSAPTTTAPTTSAPTTSAPTTSAPTTSAPVTPAPTPSSNTCSFEIRQTLASQWQTDGVTYTQYNVVYRNANSVAASPVVQLSGGQISQSWNIEKQADGYYHLPAYQSALAPNQEFSWGYIAQTTSALGIRIIC